MSVCVRVCVVGGLLSCTVGTGGKGGAAAFTTIEVYTASTRSSSFLLALAPFAHSAEPLRGLRCERVLPCGVALQCADSL